MKGSFVLGIDASRSRIVFRVFSGNSSYSAYTLGWIACQLSRAHAGGQDCSVRLTSQIVNS
jgi:hypothetical protein